MLHHKAIMPRAPKWLAAALPVSEPQWFGPTTSYKEKQADEGEKVWWQREATVDSQTAMTPTKEVSIDAATALVISEPERVSSL